MLCWVFSACFSMIRSSSLIYAKEQDLSEEHPPAPSSCQVSECGQWVGAAGSREKPRHSYLSPSPTVLYSFLVQPQHYSYAPLRPSCDSSSYQTLLPCSSRPGPMKTTHCCHLCLGPLTVTSRGFLCPTLTSVTVPVMNSPGSPYAPLAASWCLQQGGILD